MFLHKGQHLFLGTRGTASNNPSLLVEIENITDKYITCWVINGCWRLDIYPDGTGIINQYPDTSYNISIHTGYNRIGKYRDYNDAFDKCRQLYPSLIRTHILNPIATKCMLIGNGKGRVSNFINATKVAIAEGRKAYANNTKYDQYIDQQGNDDIPF